MRRLCAAGAVLILNATLVVAQTAEVRGTVRDSATRQPIAGVVVTMLDASGAVLGRLITGERGSYHIPATDAIRRIRLQRLGFRFREIPVPVVRADGAPVDLAMVALPSLLERVQVVSSNRCPKRDDGERAVALLQQARAGLLTTIVARDSNPGAIVRLEYRRFIETKGDRIVRQEVRIDSAMRSATSFRGARSGADFVSLGFKNDSTSEIYGPDADVLLDDAFADGYCFRIMDPDRDRRNQVGLGFTAVERKRGRVDIDGALWIDTAARTLVGIEYRYVGLIPGNAMRAGGGNSFHALPNGVVLIDRWFIRTPGVQLLAGRPGQPATSIATSDRSLESGGEVARATWPDGIVWRPPLGRVRIHALRKDGSPARGALIALQNTDYRAITDANGDAEIHDLLPGPYSVFGIDARIPEANLAVLPKSTFEAARDSTASRVIVTRTPAEYIEDACFGRRKLAGPDEAQMPLRRTVYVLGAVTQPDGLPAVEADVKLTHIGGSQIIPVKTDGDGVFSLCLSESRRNGTLQVDVRGEGPMHGSELRALTESLTVFRIRVDTQPSAPSPIQRRVRR